MTTTPSAPECPNCHFPVASTDVECGNCHHRLSSSSRLAVTQKLKGYANKATTWLQSRRAASSAPTTTLPGTTPPAPTSHRKAWSILGIVVLIAVVGCGIFFLARLPMSPASAPPAASGTSAASAPTAVPINTATPPIPVARTDVPLATSTRVPNTAPGLQPSPTLIPDGSPTNLPLAASTVSQTVIVVQAGLVDDQLDQVRKFGEVIVFGDDVDVPVWDTIVAKAKEAKAAGKSLVFIGNGVDTASTTYNLESAIEALQEMGMQPAIVAVNTDDSSYWKLNILSGKLGGYYIQTTRERVSEYLARLMR
jgi:hypothetical protein